MVNVNLDKWAIHCNPKEGYIEPYPVMKGYTTPKTVATGKSEFIPFDDATDDVKNCTEFTLSKNTSVVLPGIMNLVAYADRYTKDEVYPAKIVSATISGDVKQYMMGLRQKVFVLNDNGQTIEKL